MMRRVLHFAFLLLMAQVARAQATGLNLTLQYAHGLLEEDKGMVPSATFGLGIQHDFDRRIGMGFDVNWVEHEGDGLNAWEFIYSAKYFTTDNSSTALYIGSFIGVQRIRGEADLDTGPSNQNTEVSRTQIPIGLRTGVRGGLAGYFAEMFLSVGYNLGNGELISNNSSSVNSKPLYLGVGFSFLGFGWDHE